MFFIFTSQHVLYYAPDNTDNEYEHLSAGAMYNERKNEFTLQFDS